MDWLARNKEWVFSGIGVAVLSLLGWLAERYVHGRLFRPLTVRVRSGFLYHPTFGTRDHIAIEVRNRSQGAVVVERFLLELRWDKVFYVAQDSATGEYQGKRSVAAGDNLTFHIAASQIRDSGFPVEHFVRAAVVDALGRRYTSTRKEVRKAVEMMLAQN